MSATTLVNHNRLADIPASQVASVITDVTGAERARALNLSSFKFRHGLGGHAAMGLPEIKELALKFLDEGRYDQVECLTGGESNSKNLSSKERVHKALDALQSIESSNSWLRLTRVDEANGQFQEITEQFYAELSQLYQRDIKPRVMKTFVTLFISSPGEITKYHIDHTWNFLLQISGRKRVHLFDPSDPQILSQEEKESWYMKRRPRLTVKDGRGIAYDLEPGDGVHHPVNAPHFVENGAEVSVSLSLGLCLHDSNRDAKVHQVNYLLRKFGLRPRPPGKSRWQDASKALFVEMLSKRNPEKFDDLLYSGTGRLDRLLKMVGIRL
jgi:hypothetical protein